MARNRVSSDPLIASVKWKTAEKVKKKVKHVLKRCVLKRT